MTAATDTKGVGTNKAGTGQVRSKWRTRGLQTLPGVDGARLAGSAVVGVLHVPQTLRIDLHRRLFLHRR